MARKEKNIHYIYKTTCNVTGKWYVGMHSTTNENDGYMGSGKRLRYSIRKYGPDNHTKEILEYCNSREELVLREIEIVTSEFIQDEMCMNLVLGGSGFMLDDHHYECSKKGGLVHAEKMKTNDEYKTKVIKTLSRNMTNYLNKGIHNHNTFEGKNHSEETKLLMSESSKGQGAGEANSQYGTCWITKDGVNKKIKTTYFEQYQLDNWLKGRQ